MKQKVIALLGALAVAGFTVACAETDAGVTTKVKAKLVADDTVKAYQIDVDTRDHVVTLTGSVDTAAAKEQAVAITRVTEGVTSVVDNITVNDTAAATTGEAARDAAGDVAAAGRAAGQATADAARSAADKTADAARTAADKTGAAAGKVGDMMSDAAITAAVKTKFLANTTVGGLDINVDTKDGVVSLKGKIKGRAERIEALRLARETDGVKRVIDNLTIGQ